jgi:cardiolipin synthase
MVLDPDLLGEIVKLARRLPESQSRALAESFLRGSEPGAVINDPGARSELARVVEHWMGSGGTPETLAVALATAARSIADQRASFELEPVWTGPVPLRPEVRQTLPAMIDLLESAREHVLIVTFVTYHLPEVRDALLACLARGVRLTCVVEDSAVNPEVENQDPRRLLGREQADGVTFLRWPLSRRGTLKDGTVGKLHAKFMVVDWDRLLLGSANLTRAGMSTNIEFGLLVRGGALPRLMRSHIDELVRTGALAR